jgi:hypothetical protein
MEATDGSSGVAERQKSGGGSGRAAKETDGWIRGLRPSRGGEAAGGAGGGLERQKSGGGSGRGKKAGLARGLLS